MKNIHILPVIFITLLAGISLLFAQRGENVWRKTAQKDLDFIYKDLKENHPGAIDPVKSWQPQFYQQLEAGYKKAVSDLHLVTDYQSYKYLLVRYLRGFNDNHLFVRMNKHQDEENWKLPFAFAYTGKNVIVTKSPNSKISCGDILVSVNEIPVKEFFASNKTVIPFREENLESSCYKATRCLSSWPINPFNPPPKTYTFKTKAGQTVDHLLQWEKTKESSAYKPPKRNFFLQELENNCAWISLPNFYPNDQQKKQLEEIQSNLKKYRNSNAIIFDLRYNSGGSSAWGNDIIRSLVGKKHFEQKSIDDVSIYWRASKDNLAWLKKIQKDFSTKFPPSHASNKWRENAIKALTNALANNDPFFIEKENNTEQTLTTCNSKLNPSTKIICVVNEYCVSACLDFLDRLKEVANPILVGHPTSSDSLFMDLKMTELPSTQGTFCLPTQFYRGRKRGNNECYCPDIQIYDTIQDDQKLQAYVLKKVVSGQV